jgi:hypothetical protein
MRAMRSVRTMSIDLYAKITALVRLGGGGAHV